MGETFHVKTLGKFESSMLKRAHFLTANMKSFYLKKGITLITSQIIADYLSVNLITCFGKSHNSETNLFEVTSPVTALSLT